MCRLRNIAMRDYQKSDYRTDRRTHTQTPDKVIPMCRYASQATQQYSHSICFSHIICEYDVDNGSLIISVFYVRLVTFQ